MLDRLALTLVKPAVDAAALLLSKRGITADTAIRLGRYFGNSPQFWLNLQGQYDIAVIEQDRGPAIAREVRPPPRAA